MGGGVRHALGIRLVVLLAAAAGLGCAAPHPSSSALEQGVVRYNTVVGTQTTLPAYGFTSEDRLLETACRIRGMGSNVIKLALTARYFTADYHLPQDPSIRDLRDLAERQSSVRAVLDMDF